MPADFISGNFIKVLRQNYNLNDQCSILHGTSDPTSVAQDAPRGSLFLRDTGAAAEIYKKDDDGSSTNWSLVPSLGNINSLTDVNAAPADGAKLMWVNASSEWQEEF